MIEQESTLLVLLLILSIGLLIPELFRRFKLPFISLIILVGAVFGPYGLGVVELSPVIEFFGFLGMTFLMLMAGLETDFSKVKKFRGKVLIISFLNGFIPFVTGVFLTRYFDYSWTASILVGVVFISSSVAIIVPSLKSAKVFHKNIGQIILSSVLITDVLSLVILGFIFQKVSPITKLPLTVYYLILTFSLVVLFYLIPKISKFVLTKEFKSDAGYERKIRYIITLVIGVLLYFSLLGVHPMLASFLIGLMLSGIVHRDKNGMIYSKIHTLGYGIFVPVFFFIVGMEMNLGLFKKFDLSNILMISLIFGLIFSKFISGYFASRFVNLTNKESLMFGSTSIVQLTTTLAVTFTASSLGLLDEVLVTSIILLSIITTLIGPILVSYIAKMRD